MNGSRAFKPSVRLQAKYVLYVWLIFGLCILPFILFGFIPDLGWAYVVLFLIANALWIAPALLLIPLYYRSISYELGDEEVVVRKGILTKTVQTVPYRTVTNVDMKRGILDRSLGLGSLHIHTAGYSAQQTSAEAKLSGLEDYDAVAQELLTALRRYRARTGPSIGAEEMAGTAPERALLGRILEELQAVRGLLDRMAKPS